MAVCANWGMTYNYPKYDKFIIKEDDITAVVFNFTTTQQTDTTKSIVANELDNVFNECNVDDWAGEKKIKSKKISYNSYLQARTFINYINNLPVPAIVPYYTGKIGLEWNLVNNGLISVVFNTDNTFMYSIITNDDNDYGQKNQTEQIQEEFVENLSRILKRCN